MQISKSLNPNNNQNKSLSFAEAIHDRIEVLMLGVPGEK